MAVTTENQLTITLPDGSTRAFEGPVTGAEVAAAIGPGLAKAALAVKVDGQLRDLKRPIARDAAVEIVTASHADSLELLRHDCAHVLAEAGEEPYPDTQVTRAEERRRGKEGVRSCKTGGWRENK